MLITYCLTVRLLARQQQSLCGGGSKSGASSNVNGNQPNGWASGWLGQQTLGIKYNFVTNFVVVVVDFVIAFGLLLFSFTFRRPDKVVSTFRINFQSKLLYTCFYCIFNKVVVGFFHILLHSLVFHGWAFFQHRASMYMATLIKNQSTVNTESSTFRNFDWYGAFNIGYTRTMATRL